MDESWKSDIGRWNAGRFFHSSDGCGEKCGSFWSSAGAGDSAATLTPAESIGLAQEIGCIRRGARADLLILDKELNLENVIIGGQIWQ